MIQAPLKKISFYNEMPVSHDTGIAKARISPGICDR